MNKIRRIGGVVRDGVGKRSWVAVGSPSCWSGDAGGAQRVAGSEIALISLREGQLRQLERRGGAGARTLVRLARDPNRFLATIQIGITLAGFLASATAAVSLTEPLAPMFGFLGGAAEPVAIAVVTLVLTFVTLVFGELAPKRLGMQYALRWALLVARPLDLLSRLTRPVVWALSKTTNQTVRVFGGDPNAAAEQLSQEELRDLVARHRGLNPEQRTINHRCAGDPRAHPARGAGAAPRGVHPADRDTHRAGAGRAGRLGVPVPRRGVSYRGLNRIGARARKSGGAAS